MTFERKYARIPDSSYTVQTVSVPVGRLIAMSQQTPPLTSQGYSYLGVKYPTGYQEMDVDDGNGIRRVYVNSSVNADLACKVTTAYYAADIDGVEDGGVSFGNTAQIATLLPEINTGGTITSYTYWAILIFKIHLQHKRISLPCWNNSEKRACWSLCWKHIRIQRIRNSK